MILACVDVDYRDDEAMAACLLFDDWEASVASDSPTTRLAHVAPYEPGAFYKRELPCLIAVLDLAPQPPEIVVIDGYVRLGPEGRPGLGTHLYEALGRAIPVIGVAKTPFRDTPAIEVRRGEATKPLWVTAAGLDDEAAAEHIRQMHGPFRIPTLLKQVDQLCRNSWTTGCPCLNRR